MLVVGLGLCMPAVGEVVESHKPVTYHFAVTNTTDKPQMIESVRTSCACLKVNMGGRLSTTAAAREDTRPPELDAINCVSPGGVLPFEVEFNPAGMEGEVKKRVWVTLAPSKKVVTFDVAADVRLRLGFKPMDAAFGVIKRSDTAKDITAKLSGYAADGVTLWTPFLAAKNAEDSKKESVFDVRLGADGKSIIAKFRERGVLPGIYSETWTIPTSDKEIPEITFSVSARVANAVSVTPQVITVGWDEPVCSRMVMVRLNSRTSGSPVQSVNALAARSTISAETKPRKWGDVKITRRPLNGWRIDIENIDPREVRQFSKRPSLEVKTNLPGMESFEIPLRVVTDGGVK